MCFRASHLPSGCHFPIRVRGRSEVARAETLKAGPMLASFKWCSQPSQHRILSPEISSAGARVADVVWSMGCDSPSGVRDLSASDALPE